MEKIKRFKPTHKISQTKNQFNGRAKIDRMYDHAWEKYRSKYLAINKMCYVCGTQATVVDHVVPHKGDAILFKRIDNMIPLCAKCHNKATGLFDRNHRPGNPATQKIKWMSFERANRSLTFRVKVVPWED